ncbi:MAG: toxic anion resistance protein [Clostridium sp.]|nr:toxic anion resistance protein [Clostridium sp.]
MPVDTSTKAVEKSVQESVNLTPEEQRMVDEFSEKIDITDSSLVMNYGAKSQSKLSEFTDSALASVRTKDLGETGEMITSLIGELRGFGEEEKKGLFGIVKRKTAKLEAMKARYDSAEKSVASIVIKLEDHQVGLSKDVATLEEMYNRNLAYFKELTMYILAGKKKLEKERSTTLVELSARAKQSNLPEDAQKARDFADMCTRFEKKIYDLELTRNISMQMAPQIRLIQNNDIMMIEKIQTTIVNTIPLWKNQMVIALGLAHTQQAIEAERSVTDMTNQLLKQNAEALRVATVAAAEESERGIVDIETLTETNQKLIATMDDVLRIQREGHDKRVAAEAELVRMENELHRKLLEVANVETENK